jgi:hypothetical protein
MYWDDFAACLLSGFYELEVFGMQVIIAGLMGRLRV